MMPRKPVWNVTQAVVLGVSLIAIAGVTFGPGTVRTGRTDFLSFYTGARAIGAGLNPYSINTAREIQQGLSAPDELRNYIRPPFYAVLVWPLSRLPYLAASYLWQLLNLIAWCAFIYIWSPKLRSALLCLWFFPAWISLSAGQDISTIVFFFAVSQALLTGGHPGDSTAAPGRAMPVAAGIMLALCGAKFHIFTLVPLAIAAKRQWRYAAGFAAGSAALLLISFAAAGGSWPKQYIETILVNESRLDYASKMPTIVGLFSRTPLRWYWVAAGSIAIIVFSWHLMKRLPTRLAMPFSAFASLLLSPHAFAYDFCLAVPILLSMRMAEAALLWLPIYFALLTVLLATPELCPLPQVAVLGLFVWVYRHLAEDPAIAEKRKGIRGALEARNEVGDHPC